ncbi:MAG: purine permease [Erysipelothrix sp.]|nr:purine permease [Erysipelothrix sp.]
MEQVKHSVEIIYNVDDVPEGYKKYAYALQHILAMFAANVTLPILVVGAVGLNSQQGTLLIQSAMLMAGVATLIQVQGFKKIGSRLPIVMGTSNAFISTVMAIVTQFGIGAALGASFIGGLFETILGNYLDKVKSIFTPLVTGVVVMTIGITLIPVGIRQAAGSRTEIGIGSPINWFLSLLVIGVIILCYRLDHKVLKSASILIGIITGYVVAMMLNQIDFSVVNNASWISFVTPFAFKWEFHLAAIVSMLFMYLATTVETVGDASALTVVAKQRESTPEENKGAILADGLASSLAAIFNAFPNTSYTQNIGVVNLTGVFSTVVVKIGAVILIIMSLFPKLAAVILIVPEPVLGGATLVTFSMVFVSGVSLVMRTPMTSRNMLIIALSVGLGVGLSLVPEALSLVPLSLRLMLTSGVVPSALLAIGLDYFLPTT